MKRFFIFVLLAVSFFSCFQERSIFETAQSQVATRQIQSRRFDSSDKTTVLRAIIATLQDLGFIIEKADENLGVVSGIKRSGYNMKMTVSVRPFGETQMIVRANAQINFNTVDDAQPYQQFFAALSKSLFLEAHQID